MSNIMYDHANLIRSIQNIEPHYIKRPMRSIACMMRRAYLFEFLVCSVLSVGILWIPMIPVWGYCLYGMYIRILFFKKFNISPVKMIVFTAFIIAVELISAIYIRKILWGTVEFVSSLIA